MSQNNKKTGVETKMDTAKPDNNDDLPKLLTSKRTLAIVYAMLVLAFAIGLVVTDADADNVAASEITSDYLEDIAD